MHVGGPGVHSGIEQTDDRLLHAPVGVQAEHRKTDDPGLARAKA
jgi:hypothetical protein